MTYLRITLALLAVAAAGAVAWHFGLHPGRGLLALLGFARRDPAPAEKEKQADDASADQKRKDVAAADDRAAALSKRSRLLIGADFIEEEREREARRTPK